MSTPLSLTPRRRGFLPRHVLAWAALLLPVAIGAGVALPLLTVYRPAPSAGVPAPTVDPRLIIQAHTVPMTALLRGGLRVDGSLYPALPGPNTLAVRVRGSGVPGGRVVVTATMPGMAMMPVRATLVARRHGYSGVLRLPMFGEYRARVVVDTPRGQYSGTLVIPLSWPRTSAGQRGR